MGSIPADGNTKTKRQKSKFKTSQVSQDNSKKTIPKDLSEAEFYIIISDCEPSLRPPELTKAALNTKAAFNIKGFLSKKKL